MKKLINDGWLFAKLPSGTVSEPDKSMFMPVDLPHDWLIWQDQDLYESADVWYRRSIELPEDHEPVVMIRFDGVYMDCDVLLNGEIICRHPYGYTAFDVPLTDKLKPGENSLSVHIRHQSPNSRWYSGSGIFRDVFLVLLPENHIIPDGIYVKEYSTDGYWVINVYAQTAGEHQEPFFCALYESDGTRICYSKGACNGDTAEATLLIPEVKPWSPDDPYLYQLEIRYGEQIEIRKIGLRSVSVHPEKGLMLNGNRIRLKGVCLHHDLGSLGAAFHKKAAQRQLKLMKEMGANAVRTSHNPPASGFLDLCDEMGFLVIDEAFDMWEKPKTKYDYARFFHEWYQRDIESWIRRDRCHPSVIMWSVGNEIYDMHADPRGAEITAALADAIRHHDPLCHAFITFGCNYMPWEGGQKCAEYVDIVGYNYGEKLYEMHHSEHPAWIIYGSETGSVLASRGIYHFPMRQSIMSDSDRQCSALGNSNTSWGAESLKEIIINDLRHPFSLGQFIWSGIDYIGEPTPYHTRSCYFGQADTACFPKDSYYLFQSCWTELKMIHIGVSWDWNRGQIIDIPVMTNCPEAELILNGISMGRKQSDPAEPTQCCPVWRIPFVPGTLTARGYDKDRKIVCEDMRVTPGEASFLALSCENECLLSDGWDLAFVTVSAEDKNHNPVENARNRVKISVSGGGRLLGTDNGDSTDTDGYKSDCRRLFSGKMLLIIGSNGEKQNVHIHVCSNDGIAAELCIPVKQAVPVEGISSFQKAYSRVLTDNISARRVDITALNSTAMTADTPQCSFRYTVMPVNATCRDIIWQVTNTAGIESPFAKVMKDKDEDIVTVNVYADGQYYLRALYMENSSCSFISQIEFSASGFGQSVLNPYTYICAGLYDIHQGEIGAGNEKGIAFARDSKSMIGFRNVDFGKTGSDTITADIFALNEDLYDIELWAAHPEKQERMIAVLHYQKPSIWNVYQPETWKLPERLAGIQTISFRTGDKIHLKGFVFEKQSNAFILHPAGTADSIYGDSFHRCGDTVTDIGNNVTLIWTDMDFEGLGNVVLEINGQTPSEVNTINIRIKNEKGNEKNATAEFRKINGATQKFILQVPEGNCTVSFVFLPGSSFDFRSFRFYRPDSWTDTEE